MELTVVLNHIQGKYIYMCDIYSPELIFAMDRLVYPQYRDIYHEYELRISEMPESYTVEVYRLTLVAKDTYELLDMTPVQYQIKRIYFVFTK